MTPRLTTRHRMLALAGLATVALLSGALPGAAQTMTPAAAITGLEDPHPCPDIPDFTCATVTVPLDHSGEVPGELHLPVAVSDNEDAPRGVLLFLSGGPGQPGVATLPRVKQTYIDPSVLDEYRLVMFDQRGTGGNAIDCAPLQGILNGSDWLYAPREPVEACADQLGESRAYYTTPDTTDDIDLLRQALGVSKLTLDGVSYGSFTAEQYALRYPHRVRKMVLDSVVPHIGFDPLGRDSMQANARVLRAVCAADPACTSDPVADLAYLVRHGYDGDRVLEAMAIISIFAPSFDGVPKLLHDARNGDTAGWDNLLNSVLEGGTPAQFLSSGLHVATICADLTFPWGDATTPVDEREAPLKEALDALTDHELYPYDKRTAERAQPISGCRYWPVARASDYSSRRNLPAVPTLLLNGDRDLSTPLEWALWEAKRARLGQLYVAAGAGHGTQARDPSGQAQV